MATATRAHRLEPLARALHVRLALFFAAAFGIVIAAIGLQLLAYHLWLAAGRRRLADVWPGVLLSIVLWLLAARLFGSWLAFSDYSRFYAGLTSIMSALVFFQISAIIIILGAELNRGLLEMKERRVIA